MGEQEPGTEDGLGENVENGVGNDLAIETNLAGAIGETPDATAVSNLADNSVEFKSMPNVFDQPVMCLMSPVEYPSSVQDKSEIGRLFTLFLHTPLLGFCSVSDIGNLDQSKWDECVRKIAAMEKSIGDLLISDVNVGK